MSKFITTCSEPETLIAGFPNKKMSIINREPMANDIKLLKTEAVQNLISHPCELASGKYGWSGIVLSDTVAFTTLTGNNSFKPILPVFGQHDEHTLPHICNELERDFAKDSRQWNTFNNLTRSIRTQLIEAITDEYICTL